MTKLSKRMSNIEESATLALNARALQLVAEGRTVYNLTAGELASDTPGFIQDYVKDKLQFNKYTPVAGLPELRQKIAAHAHDFYGLDWIESKNVVVTGGAKPALYSTLLSIVNEGDEVIIPTPAWLVSYKPLVELAGGTVIEVPLDADFDLDVSAIKNAVTDKTKAILLNSPNNPTGGVYSAHNVKQLAEYVNDTDIVVISDDIYTRLVYENYFTLVPKAGFNNLIIINGFSKSQALTGWRIGYIIAPLEIASAATSLLSHINGNAALPSQYAAIAAMDKGDEPPFETIEALKQQRQLVIDRLTEAGVKHNEPKGAFYIMLDVREFAASSAEWCEKLLVEAGVALVPGEPFGAPGFARLTFVADIDVLNKALDQISKFVKGQL